MHDRPEALLERVLAHVHDGRFTGLLRVRTREAEAELWFLSGIREETRFGVSTGDEALERLLKAHEPTFEAAPRLPGLTGSFRKSLAPEGSLADVRAVALLRYCETYALTCTLDLASKGKSARVRYQVGELLSVDTDAAGDDALTEMLDSAEGSYRFELPAFELPPGTPLFQAAPSVSLLSELAKISVGESARPAVASIPPVHDEAARAAEEQAKRRALDAAAAEARRKVEAEAEARRAAEAEAQRHAAAEAEARRKAEAEARRAAEAEAEARRKVQAEAEARRRAEAATEARRRAEFEAKRNAELEAEARRKVEAAAEARRAAEAEAARKAEAEAEARRQVEAEAEAARKAEAEAEAHRRAEAEAKRAVEAEEAERAAKEKAALEAKERGGKPRSAREAAAASSKAPASMPASSQRKAKKRRNVEEVPPSGSELPVPQSSSKATWIFVIVALVVVIVLAWLNRQ